jgi:hypothetical protein
VRSEERFAVAIVRDGRPAGLEAIAAALAGSGSVSMASPQKQPT